MEAGQVLQEQIEYASDYCNACSNQCRRRRLEDQQEDENQNGNNGANYYADCDTCVDQCSPLLNNYYEGYDETEYLDCQEAYADEDGVQYYSGPACDSEGLLTIGLYYDGTLMLRQEILRAFPSETNQL